MYLRFSFFPTKLEKTHGKDIMLRSLANDSHCISSSPNASSIQAQQLYNSTAVVAWLYMTGIFCCIGPVCNLFLLVVVLKYRSLRQGNNGNLQSLIPFHWKGI